MADDLFRKCVGVCSSDPKYNDLELYRQCVSNCKSDETAEHAVSTDKEKDWPVCGVKDWRSVSAGPFLYNGECNESFGLSDQYARVEATPNGLVIAYDEPALTEAGYVNKSNIAFFSKYGILTINGRAVSYPAFFPFDMLDIMKCAAESFTPDMQSQEVMEHNRDILRTLLPSAKIYFASQQCRAE